MARGFEDVSWDDKVAVVGFTGAGEKAFCTGGVVKEYQQSYMQKPRDYWKYMCCFKSYIESITNCAKPVIASPHISYVAGSGGRWRPVGCSA